MLIVIFDIGIEEVTPTGIDVRKISIELGRDKSIIAVQNTDMRNLGIRNCSCDCLVQGRIETCASLG